MCLKRRFWRKLSLSVSGKEDMSAKARQKAKDQKQKKWLSKSGQDVEDGIAPAGKRDRMEQASNTP
jgi:hypothetical protein